MNQDVFMQLAEKHRERNTLIGSRNRVQNTLHAHVRTYLGYKPTMLPAERAEYVKQASNLIKSIVKGNSQAKSVTQVRMFVEDMWRSVASLNMCISTRTKEMERLAATLPVAEWIKNPAQNGAGLLTLAQIVGECGDLANYPSPAHLWSRMGAAPYTSEGRTQMGSTWKRATNGQPRLTADEWIDYGRCPRRATLTHVIGENLIRQNFIRSKTKAGKARKSPGPYRARFDESKAVSKKSKEHRDWPDARHNNHAVLLAGKRFLLELWKQWNPTLVRGAQ